MSLWLWCLQVDQRVFRDLMSEKLPRLHAHFEQYKVDFSLITFNWFLVVFVDSVVSDILFKIWDAFLFEGPKVGSPPSSSFPNTLAEHLDEEFHLDLTADEFWSVLERIQWLVT